jgi:hypothetical protein
MARNTKTDLRPFSSCFLSLGVELYYFAKENAFSWLKTAKTANKQYGYG